MDRRCPIRQPYLGSAASITSQELLFFLVFHVEKLVQNMFQLRNPLDYHWTVGILISKRMCNPKLAPAYFSLRAILHSAYIVPRELFPYNPFLISLDKDLYIFDSLYVLISGLLSSRPPFFTLLMLQPFIFLLFHAPNH